MYTINKSTAEAVSRVELDNLLDNFKIDILGILSEKINTLKVKTSKRMKMLHCISFVQNVERSMP